VWLAVAAMSSTGAVMSASPLGRIRPFEAFAMDLQTMRGKPVTSENASPLRNFRAYSPHTADRVRLQPGHRSEQIRGTASRHDVELDAR